ncbi:MAG: YraN family protein [Lachnospiraceae bacterium]|nr:YraN family protein [Lachnospiraceae bacterium]
MNKREIGSFKEQKACDYLCSQGVRIIDRNFCRRSGEIDIIAGDGEYLAFVEVKFRSSNAYGGAAYAISKVKQKRIRETAAAFLRERGTCGYRFFRFDAVLITGNRMEYIKNAWQ